ncbi:MAG TPA: protein kinase [Ktedonobacteraceae bacterium]|nr:protein kinase [Ktedonobacteraceae bacterium]
MTLSPIYCSECGALNVPGAKFCVTCGHVMHVPVEQAPLPTANPTGTGLLPQDSLLNKRYRIRKLVGTGGMGAVYKAEDTPYGDRPVAIKEMRQSSLTPQELEIATGQFKVEAIMLARLQHPSLPRIYDHFLESNRWYLVMDFIDGETLDERLRRTPGRKLPPQEVIDISIQLCKVLDYLHKRQPPVVFRDLKPSNVMLTPEGHLYLIDFGIARIFKPGQAKDTKAYGSIGYSAPEQFDREQTTDQADIYSLGITMHEMLSGSIPALTPFSMPRLSFPGQPALERLAALIMSMIEMDKEKRPASITAVRQELESIRDALRQPAFIPSAAQPAAPPTQYTPQTAQEAPHLAPTQYVPPPMAATVAIPDFADSAKQAAVATQLPRPVARRNLAATGNTRVIAALVGIVIYAVVTFILGKIFLDAQTTGNSFLLSAIIPAQSTNAYFVRWDYFVLGLSFFIPCFFAARYGSIVGLVVAVIGALLGDVLSQFLPAWYWFAGFAALGLIAGLAYIKTRGSYNKAGNIMLAIVCSFVAILIWAIILLVGDFRSLTVDFGIFLPTLLTLTLVQLASLVPLVIALVASNAFTKVRASQSA